MTSSSGLWEDDFGQKVDLTRRIREILENYPEGISVLKELIQNADDAGADVIKFCYDSRSHPTTDMSEASMAEFQNHALLVFNNSKFSESDFLSIQSIGSSLSKRSDLNKTGKFGLGFNSVYHLTELPSFVSDQYLIYFDPQCMYLPNINASNPGKRINFVKQSSKMNEFQNQFNIYKIFNNNMNEPFDGTLFRLPLRTKKQALISKLSKKYYSEYDIQTFMFELFINEGEQFLLFLKCIQNIQWYIWKDIKQSHPTLIYECKITSLHSNTNQQIIRNYISSISKFEIDDVHNSWMECDLFQFETRYKSKIYSSEWIICNALGGGSFQCSGIAANKDYKHMKLLPYGGIAARISTNVPWHLKPHSTNQRIDDNQNIHSSFLKKKVNEMHREIGCLEGRAYCFLSLPLKTSFPVHLNGYFELSSNRRDLWWNSTNDMAGDGSIRYFWNMTLLQDVICNAYIRILTFAKTLVIKNKITIEQFYHLWPYTVPGYEPFEILCQEVLSEISEQSFLYSKKNGGLWLKYSDAVVCDQPSLTNVENNEQKINDDDGNQHIINTLLNIGIPIVNLPRNQFQVLNKSQRPPTQLSPGI